MAYITFLFDADVH